ncbi:hypothetical protein ACFWAR_19690 [Streptomyces sp. NPDC059917]|uniref:hypothetical protein n=1 Tax=Streptomyces sp. NPDC059917 TaxID=3347002 RepID=UPI003668A01A
MADEDVEQTEPRGHAPGVWWAELSTWGAVATIIFGGAAAVWVSFRLPGTPQNLASGYYGAAKVVAIGLVTVGCTLLGRRRARTSATEETNGRKRV